MATINCAICTSYYGPEKWCNHHGREEEPYSTCSYADDGGSNGGGGEQICDNCESYDPNYQYGYCDYHHCRTSASGYCSGFGWK